MAGPLLIAALAVLFLGRALFTGEVLLPGGSLWIKVTEDLSAVSMRGPAMRVFRGELEA